MYQNRSCPLPRVYRSLALSPEKSRPKLSRRRFGRHDGVSLFLCSFLFIVMACNYYEITNFNNVQEGYYRWTGCTGGIISVSQLDPLDRAYVCAEDLTVEEYSSPLTVVNLGLCPSATPTQTTTPSVTPTVTMTPTQHTPTPTPTYTCTPSQTPGPVYKRNLVCGWWYEDVCNQINQFAGPSNITIFTSKPFSQLVKGDHVWGNKEFTIPPVNLKFTISDGATFIQVTGTEIINVGTCY